MISWHVLSIAWDHDFGFHQEVGKLRCIGSNSTIGKDHPAGICDTIRKHDETHPEAAIFAQAEAAMAEDERGRILKLFRHGMPIDRLARRACRPRSAVYRVIVEERIGKLNRRKVRNSGTA